MQERHAPQGTSWWDRLIADVTNKSAAPPPTRQAPALQLPKVDQSAWAKSVEQKKFRDLTVHDVGLIVFNESQSYSDRPDSNEPIGAARQKIAHVVVNGDQQWGSERQRWARTAGAIEPSAKALENPKVQAAYDSSMEAAREAYLSGSDPTNGALYAVQKDSATRANEQLSKENPKGVPISTQSGPYDNSFPNKRMQSRIAWLNTYSDGK